MPRPLLDDREEFVVDPPYEDASARAQVECEAATVFEAERVGLAAIDFALAWLSLMTQYSATPLPDGTVGDYERSWTSSRPRRADVVIVVGDCRSWIREPITQSDRPVLDWRRSLGSLLFRCHDSHA